MADERDVEKSGEFTARSDDENVNQDERADMERLEPVQTNNGRPACFHSTVQEVLFVLTSTMAIAMSSILTGAITVISSFVGRDLNMTTAQITWLNAGVSLSAGAFLLFFGKLADMFGRKKLFVGSLFLFSVFALAAGFCNTPIALDVLAGVLGLFSASAVPPAVGILGAAYDKPSKRKNAAFACFAAGNPLGFVFGTIFGGVAATLFGWRASFWLVAIIFFALTIVGVFTIPKDWTDKDPFAWETVKRFDMVGTMCTIMGIGMFCAALSLGDTAPQGWKTPYVLALLIVGVLLLVVFVFWEHWFKYPLMPMSIWRDRDFSLVLAILTLGMMSFIPASFFVSLYLQRVKHLSSILVAVHLLPMAIMGLIVNIIAGLILHRVSNKILMYIGTSAYAIAFLLLALNRHSSSYWSFIFPGLTIVVIGADLQFNVANMYVMSSMATSQQSVAGGIFQTAAKLASSVGLGIATAVFNAVQQNPGLAAYWDDATQPYTATFWYAFVAAALSVCLVPFLTIGTQGGKVASNDTGSVGSRGDDNEKEKEMEVEISAGS